MFPYHGVLARVQTVHIDTVSTSRRRQHENCQCQLYSCRGPAVQCQMLRRRHRFLQDDNGYLVSSPLADRLLLHITPAEASLIVSNSLSDGLTHCFTLYVHFTVCAYAAVRSRCRLDPHGFVGNSVSVSCMAVLRCRCQP